LGGLLHFPDGSVDADTFVLTLPMAEHREALALFVFIGGLSAAAAMVIVETIALSTMVCNDLVMPALLRQHWLRLHERQDLSGVLLLIRRWAIAGILLLGYVYFRGAGEAYAWSASGSSPSLQWPSSHRQSSGPFTGKRERRTAPSLGFSRVLRSGV